jgi:thiol-disulfide isomerase/thioredoxin
MNKHILSFLLAIGLIFSCSACLVVDNPYSGLPPGPWRAILKVELNPTIPNPKGEPLPEKVDLQLEEIAAGELPFNFEVIYVNEDSFYIEIINDEERIIVDDITIGRDRGTAKDTIVINFPIFDSYIKGIFVENVIQGEWVVNNRDNYSIPFVAYHGRNHRFTNLRKTPVMDVSGKWEVTFGLDEDEEPYKAIGDFKQDGNHLAGTFRTESGDYRYLEGTIQEDRLYLSVFDGSHAFLFGAKILSDSTMTGFFRSGNHYRTLWDAKKNQDFELTAPEELTKMLDPTQRFYFSFENPAGETVSLLDDRYQNKVKIIQIFGTWCPNCRDETEFLVDYLKNNPNQNLEVIALAFERHQNPEKAVNAIKRYQEKYEMGYEILLAGTSDDKSEATKTLPMLDKIISFPTMVFLDRNNQVKRIHTGFNGPATSEYQNFKSDFESFVQELLSENLE